MTPRQSIATTIVLALLGFELIVLAILAFFPYLPDPGLATLNMSLYTLLAPLSTILLLGLLYAWLVRLVTREASRRSSSFNAFTRFLSEPFQKLLSSVKNTSLSESAYNFEILSRPKLMLTVSIVVSVLLVFVPYRPDLNPTGDLVGVDSPTYVGWLGQMLALPLPGALRYSFVGGLDGSRPLLLVLLYLVGSAGVSPSQLIEFRCTGRTLHSSLVLYHGRTLGRLLRQLASSDNGLPLHDVSADLLKITFSRKLLRNVHPLGHAFPNPSLHMGHDCDGLTCIRDLPVERDQEPRSCEVRHSDHRNRNSHRYCKELRLRDAECSCRVAV